MSRQWLQPAGYTRQDSGVASGCTEATVASDCATGLGGQLCNLGTRRVGVLRVKALPGTLSIPATAVTLGW